MYTVWTYAIYLVVSVCLTIWVAQTLFKHGRAFLVDAFSGNETLADSVNHLLVVGFYLINVGYVTLALKYGDKPGDLVQAIEFGSMKIGMVLLVVGTMHFFNLYLLAQSRKRRLGHRGPSEDKRAVPVPPSGLAAQLASPMDNGREAPPVVLRPRPSAPPQSPTKAGMGPTPNARPNGGLGEP